MYIVVNGQWEDNELLVGFSTFYSSAIQLNIFQNLVT